MHLVGIIVGTLKIRSFETSELNSQHTSLTKMFKEQQTVAPRTYHMTSHINT